MWDSGSNCHDPSFEDDADLEEKKIIANEKTLTRRRQEFVLPETKITRLLKTGVEPEWFNTKHIFDLYTVQRNVHDRHLAYMLCATWRTACMPFGGHLMCLVLYSC